MVRWPPPSIPRAGPRDQSWRPVCNHSALVASEDGWSSFLKWAGVWLSCQTVGLPSLLERSTRAPAPFFTGEFLPLGQKAETGPDYTAGPASLWGRSAAFQKQQP